MDKDLEKLKEIEKKQQTFKYTKYIIPISFMISSIIMGYLNIPFYGWMMGAAIISGLIIVDKE